MSYELKIVFEAKEDFELFIQILDDCNLPYIRTED